MVYNKVQRRSKLRSSLACESLIARRSSYILQ